jgi:uncharacterized membrane protein YfcA
LYGLRQTGNTISQEAMQMKYRNLILTGMVAGLVNGLAGAGGGMILLPLLRRIPEVDEDARFPTGLAIMLPITITTLVFTGIRSGIDWMSALPWLPGAGFGGLAAGLWGRKIPTQWLHRALGILMVFGGVRYLWG